MKVSTNPKVIKFSKAKKRPKLNLYKVAMVLTITLGALIGLGLATLPNTYQISMAGKVVGTIKELAVIEKAKETLIFQLKESYQTNVKLQDELEIKKVRGKKKDEITPEYLITYMRKNANILIEFRELKVDNERIGIIKDDKELETLKQLLKKEYYGDQPVKVEFAKNVTLSPVYAKESEVILIDKLLEKCMETTPKVVEYEVRPGDTLSGIALKLGTNIVGIVKENPGMTEQSPIRIGMKLKARVNEPLLGLSIIEEETNTDKEQ